MSERRVGLLLIAFGLVGAGLAQLTIRARQPPLYDGVIPLDPYVWLVPPPGHPGGAQGDSATLPVDHGQSPEIIISTPETTPQAQLQAIAGALVLARGATSLKVAIQPIPVPQPPSTGYIDGNVYSITVVDQAGQAATAPPSSFVSIVLRAADPSDTDATIERFGGTSWLPLETEPNGEAGFFTVITTFGEFAVVASGVSPYPTLTPTATIAATAPATAPSTVGPSAVIGASAQPVASLAPASPAADDATVAILAAGVALAIIFATVAWLLLVRRRRRGRDGW